MTAKKPKPARWYAQRYCDRYGFHLVAIEPGRKFPTAKDWGSLTISDADEAQTYWTERPDWNIGLALGPSGMCSLDIDCEESFQAILAEFGIDPDPLWQYPAIRGRDKGRRLLFRVPEGVELPYAKLNWPTEADPSKRFTVLELRASCDGKQRQDVLPPSIHPDTQQPYTWLVQPAASREDWPEPPDWLLSMWTAWDRFRPQLAAACPWVEPEPAPPPKRPPVERQGGSVIEAFCDAHDLRATLERYGYERKGRARYLSPHTTTKLPGVVLFPGEATCWVHHASDPLCSDDSGQPVNAFDLFCEYEHGGDVSKAVKAAADALGLDSRPQRPERPAEVPADEPEQAGAGEPGAVATCGPGEPGAVATGGPPFRPLGYSGNSYYYLPRGTEQVAEIRRSSHTSPAELMALAPLEYWERHYEKPGKGAMGADWHAAASHLMRLCEQRGIYSPDLERGRGAWYDEGRAVLHLGGELVVDGERRAISDHQSRYIYTRQASLEHGADVQPAGEDLSRAVGEVFRGINWTKPVHAELLAGWCFLAPICGALPWRPHVWMTAQRGAGKSWIQDNIIGPLLGPAALMVQGSTTEAGIRQRLKQDSRPIVFDEAESEDQRSQHRLQTVIELARQSSSDSSAEIVKGTVGGHAMAFRMRSMFLLGSINVALSQAADESRFSVITIASANKSPAEFEQYAEGVARTLSPENCAAIRALAYRGTATIRQNARTFARAVAEVLGSQRIGDQVGTLLAGSYTLQEGRAATLQDAADWISGLDFTDAADAQIASDEERCLQHVMQAQVRFDADRGGSVSRTIGELVDLASGRGDSMGIKAAEAGDVLRRYGLKVDGHTLVVSNTHAELKRILKDTPWGGGWSRIVARIPGAVALGGSVRFAGTSTRAVAVPLEYC